MFLDVFDLVLANILPNIEQIFKGECAFSHAVSVFLVIHNANWINNYIFLVCKAHNVFILHCHEHIPT